MKSNIEKQTAALSNALSKLRACRALIRKRKYHERGGQDTESRKKLRKAAAKRLGLLRQELWFRWRRHPCNRPDHPWAAKVIRMDAYRGIK